jgi:Sad1 / UNC-like C-terminal
VLRDSVPPSHPAHFQPSLDEVLETDDLSGQDVDVSRDSDSRSRPRAQSRDRPPASLRVRDNARSATRNSHSDTDIRQMEAQTHGRESPPFSLGRFLGKIVHFFLRKIIQSMAMLVFLVWTVIAGIFTVLVYTPLRWIEATTRSARHDLPWSNISKVMFFAFAVAVGGVALRPSTIAGSSFGDAVLRWIPNHNAFTYRAPDIPAESVQDLVARLTHVESALADLAFKEQQVQKAHSVEKRVHGEVASRVELLHGRIEAEAQRALEAEEQFRAAAAKGLTAIRNEFATLQSEWERLHGEGATGNAALDDLRELQERVGTVEGGVKEALELGKASKTNGNVGWWNKWNGVGEGKLTIKSNDGQDVTGLIGSLVDHAISRFSKDTLGKPDFALYTAGGRVIPQLTTNTYEVKPNTWARYVVGAVTGSGYTMGRPPVTAIHPDINVGNCWPFAGTHGQIGLLLARNVFISGFSIDHAPRDVAYDVRSAPRQMEMWGLVQGKDNVAKVREYQQSVRARREEAVRRAEERGVPPPTEDDSYPPSLPRSPHYIRLAQFSYDIHSPEHIQTFNVPMDIQEIGADFGVVVLLIKNNWGEEDFTCLYRLRVHGTDKDRRPYLLPEHDAP